ncbi:unnamed protein product [Eruca vesicaria subsp. sativa]|uniref:DC-UbP/UBTD2 N-terminal domain-containing protein n=1 Tax=Eruca vesicaria subsp. sativa TaxID=29727 RepID=A0ABC8INB4_ERUVS|nr:unnamed protein product [Eruca vesicaria subsp. sativa]
MGCAGSTHSQAEGSVKKIRKPKLWKHTQPITKAELMKLREEFWDTAPHYSGRKEIWDALRAAAEAGISLAQTILEAQESLFRTMISLSAMMREVRRSKLFPLPQ